MSLFPDPDPPKIPVGLRRLWIGLHVLSTEEWVSGVRDRRCPNGERACGPVKRLEEVKEGQR